MKKADLIITVSENEKNIIFKTSGMKNIIVIGHPIAVQENIENFCNRRDILFVGGFLATDGPNDDAILCFLERIWPKLQKILSCKLYIVGINPPDSIKKFSSKFVIVTGYVPNLQEYYDKCRVFIVPHRYAAGIPWKLQEAMSYGIPSVVSELIASQLNIKDGKEALVAKDSEEFVEKIKLLYEDERLWFEIQQSAVNYMMTECKPEIVKKTLGNMLEDTIT